MASVVQRMKFAEWLQTELNKRQWTQAELARRANTTDATLSRIISGTRQAGPDAALAIARALKEPPERVFRLAGLLPPGPSSEQMQEIRELAELLGSLPDGPIREQAMVAILAIARDAMARAREGERVREGG